MKTFMVFMKFFFLLVILLEINACDFAPGSYPNAEIYELNYSEEEVKSAVTKFKHERPEYIVPKVTIDGKATWDLIDEESKEPNHLFIFYFYYAKENQIILTWIRPAEKGKTTFAFVSINEGLKLGNWKEINKDFSGSENKEEKMKFEQQILNKIMERL